MNTYHVEVLSRGNQETSHSASNFCIYMIKHIFRQMLLQFQKYPLKINVSLFLLTYFHTLSLTSEMLI